MSKRFATTGPTVLLALVLTACQDAGTPTQPAAAGHSAPTSESASPVGAVLYDVGVQQMGSAGSDFVCTGAATGPHDNIVVPPGATCRVTNAQVRGNIKALQDAILGVSEGTVVQGSIYGDKADVVQIRNTTVHGNIEIAEGGPSPSPNDLEVLVCATDLPNGNVKVIKMTGRIWLRPFALAGCAVGVTIQKGNLQVEDNVVPPGHTLEIRSNSVAQNLQVYKTRGPGAKFVQNNTAGESVQCFDNELPFVGSPNAAPKRDGQCP